MEVELASIDKRSGKYRVRYRDPLGRSRNRIFRRKADAGRLSPEEIEQWLYDEFAAGLAPSARPPLLSRLGLLRLYWR